jgi:hypothetical protein
MCRHGIFLPDEIAEPLDLSNLGRTIITLAAKMQLKNFVLPKPRAMLASICFQRVNVLLRFYEHDLVCGKRGAKKILKTSCRCHNVQTSAVTISKLTNSVIRRIAS